MIWQDHYYVMLNLSIEKRAIPDGKTDEQVSEDIVLALLTGQPIPYKISEVWEPLYNRGELSIEE